ncbi:hypothetical protein J6590_074370 [Homalodisca vitripennis]|nr:hypothetical protein J6590_074370 [Homalodisca vitripennis]
MTGQKQRERLEAVLTITLVYSFLIEEVPFSIAIIYGGSDVGGGGVPAVAQSFNTFFSNVGNKLATELPPPLGPPLIDESAYRVGHEFHLEPVSANQVLRCVGEMRGGSAPGMDAFPAAILKNCIEY